MLTFTAIQHNLEQFEAIPDMVMCAFYIHHGANPEFYAENVMSNRRFMLTLSAGCFPDTPVELCHILTPFKSLFSLPDRICHGFQIAAKGVDFYLHLFNLIFARSTPWQSNSETQAGTEVRRGVAIEDSHQVCINFLANDSVHSIVVTHSQGAGKDIYSLFIPRLGYTQSDSLHDLAMILDQFYGASAHNITYAAMIVSALTSKAREQFSEQSPFMKDVLHTERKVNDQLQKYSGKNILHKVWSTIHQARVNRQMQQRRARDEAYYAKNIRKKC